MDEAALLQRTRDLVYKANLPTTFGLGEAWIIVLATSEILPPSAADRYESALADLKAHFPGDVLDFSHTHRSGAARYLLLRAGSPVVNYWQGRSA
jgi:hypothetical protein